MAMNPAMRMMMLDRIRQPQNNGSEYGGGNRRMIGYDRDHDGQAAMGGYGYREEPEARRRRDSRGRYMMGGMDHEDEPRSYSPYMNGGGSRYGFGDVYANIDATGAMNRPGGMMGGMHSDMMQPVDEHTARMWVSKMDGGEKFKPEQVEQLRTTICPECGKWEFYAAINAMYSDYCETAKKMGVDKLDFYGHLAKDFLKDKDAKPHKLRRYMEHIAK